MGADSDQRYIAADVTHDELRRLLPGYAAGTIDDTSAAMRKAMTTLLYRVQEEYPHPEGAYWVPRRLGGSAPTMDEAKALEEAELAERARKRAQRDAKSHR